MSGRAWQTLLAELKRRKVVRVAAVYAASAFVVLQAADLILPALLLPEWTYRLLVLLALFGFPVALVLAWALELTPGGLRVTAASRDGDDAPAPSLFGGPTLVATALLLATGAGLGTGLAIAPRTGGEPAASGSRTPDRSVAVLPFVDLSQGGDQTWIAEGIAEEILASLARLHELRVVARGSSFRFAIGELDDRHIADTLGVAHLVKGSVRRVGDQLRVSAQLVRAADGVQIWADRYERPTAGIFEVQEDIAENIARALDIYLDDERRAVMFASGTRHVGAFEAYLRGRALYDRGHQVFSPEDRWAANEYLDEAIRLDPRFAAAYSLRHDAYAHFLMQDMPAADPSLTDALALQRIRDDLSHANRYATDIRLRVATRLVGAIFSENWSDVPDAVRELEAFVETGRAEVPGPGWSDMLLVAIGRADLGLRRAENNIRHDPLDPFTYADAAGAALALGNADAVLEYVARGYRLSPHHGFLRRIEAISLLLAGRVGESACRLLDLRDDYFYRPLGLALIGEHEAARRMATAQAEALPRDGSSIWVFAELAESDEVRRQTARIDASPVGALSFLRLIYYSGGHVPFDMDAAPRFRARLREAGIDPDLLKPWPASPRAEEVPCRYDAPHTGLPRQHRARDEMNP